MALNKYVRKTLKILAWTIGSILGLFLLVVLLIQIPYVQQRIKDKAVTYLEGKIHTPVKIGRIEIGLPKYVILEDVYIESQQKDTLLAGEKIKVDISLFKLLDNQVELNSVMLEGITANVKRNKDSVFNFDYIIKAFDSGKAKDSSAPMVFSLKKVKLDNVRLRFDDAISKNNLKIKLTHFDTDVKKFDLDKMDFDVPEINLDGLKLNLEQGDLVREIAVNTIEKTDSIVKATPHLNIKLKKIRLSKINVAYDNKGTQLNSGLSLDKLGIDFKKSDLPKQQIIIDNLNLEGVKGALTIGKYDKAPEIKTAPGSLKNDWKISVNNTNLKNINFRFDDENAKPVANGIDYKHMAISGFNLKANKLNYSKYGISGKLASLSAKEKKGLDIQSLKTDFSYNDKGASLRNLYLKTPKTLIQDQISVAYSSLDAIKENPGNLSVNANLKDSHIAFEDILMFVPGLSGTNPFKDNKKAVLNINGKIDGQLSDLNIPNLEVSGIGNTTLAASGKIKGLPDVKTAYFDLNIRNLKTSAKDIKGFVPEGTLPSNIQLPSQIALKGQFKGAINNFNTNLTLNSSFGNAKVRGRFDQRVKNRERYDGDVALDNFDLGKLLKNDSLGKISVKAKVKGVGLNPKTANAAADINLVKARFNGYDYKNLALKGTIRNGKFEATAGMNDPNLDFDLVSEGDFSGKYPAVKLRLNVDIADLNKLNLHAGVMKLRGKVDADIDTADPDFLNGKISAYHLVIANEKEQFQLDSVNIIAVSTAERNSLQIRSQFLKADIDGKYQLTKIGTALSNSIAKYYDTNPKAKKTATPPQQFAFKVNIINDPVIMKLVPQITRIEPMTISGRYNSVNDTITVDASIPRLVYGANTISNAVIKIGKEGNALVYSAVIDEVQSEEFRLPYTSLTGRIENNLIAYRLQLKDAKDKDHYIVAGTLKSLDGDTELHLIPADLLLNYEPWLIADNNVVRFGSKGIYADNFELSNNGSAVKIQSQSTAANAPLNVDFRDFDIETISRMVQKDSLALGGRLNGNVVLKDLMKKPVFTSDLKIANLTFKKDTIGDVAIQVDNELLNSYRAKVRITGQENLVNLDGTYRSDNSSFDTNLDIDRLNITSIQPFTAGNIAKGSGYVSGDMKISGTVDAPKIIGGLQFHNGAFTVVKLNSPFNLMNDRIDFTETGIVFTDFSLSDAEKNTLTIKGKVNTSNYRDYGFALNINADNFRAMDSKAKDNDLYYGKLFLNSRLSIRGDLNKPIIDGTIKINEDTRLTIVLPQPDPSIADREGIVEFIDQDNPQLNEKLVTDADLISKTPFKGLDVSVNIEIDKDAELTLIIDKGNGDFVKVKGEARLSGGIDESGKTTLTGRYELKEGSYEMTFNLLKRKFNIREGSYILWTGEPTSADINITAVYNANVAPIDLLDDQLGSVTPAIRNTYKQRLPFELLLKLNGELLKPDITFDITLPEKNYGVSSDVTTNTRAKLEQLRQEPAELNKQVFALLLLNRFIGENPFASESGTSAEGMARQSVSKILSQQLNDLAGNLIKGVDIVFDLESTEDYTSGQRENKTDLNVAVSKKLLNDRLKVTVGSNFDVEGEQQVNEQANTIAGDVSADYQLSKDGRYVLRAYRKNEYQVALQGQVIETGVAFIITMDYDKFSELFHRSKEEKREQRLRLRKEKELKAKEEAQKAAEFKEQQKEKEADKTTETKKP
ncbi:translocation/assembly module TamB domain-containing protein [Flavobacterium pallidum]|uniref:Translocation and assembly module TamB C-terminal domain-containing protein n=1 Tax=Flavobacterium pallidum TaxID=2172098 RepID=A0A2S1SIN2_9FLAO|nr:translocation/assembly module TamB [Flavobacterium pallidum]AWI26260.1 hypothetical protein HYN49_10300 [Flavobacterium pallidum]